MPIVSLSFSSKLEESALSSIEDQAAELLKLSMTGSVQIVECVERPGAIIVRWDEVRLKLMDFFKVVACEGNQFYF